MAVNASPTVTFAYAVVTVMLTFLAWRQVREQGKLDWSPIDNDSEPMAKTRSPRWRCAYRGYERARYCERLQPF
jgi:hypothetical protein